MSPVLLCGDCKLEDISQQTGAPCKHGALLLAELSGFTQQRPWAGTRLDQCLMPQEPLTTKRAQCPSAILAMLSLGKLQKAGLQSLVMQPLPVLGNGRSGMYLPLCLSTDTPKAPS